MKNTRDKLTESNRSRLLSSTLLVPVIALILVIAIPQVWASGHHCIVELDEAEVFIEFNSTDDDRGIQFFWDGEAWSRMKVKNESRRTVLNVVARRNVRAQGLTEGFFESAEPTGEELPPDEFFARFPEGEYRFRGRTLDGCWLVGEAELTHDLPIPVELNVDDFPAIKWTQPAGGPEVVGYEVVVELVVIEDDDEHVFVNTATFTGETTEFTVSPEFLQLIVDAEDDVDELKVEVIAREESGNKTITEKEVD
jgi:hypothetical protein